MSYDLCIVVPCYNAQKVFDPGAYHSFLSKHVNTMICFVNDGSTDDSIIRLNKVREAFPDRAIVLSHQKNKGKAEAVRTGMLHCSQHFNYKYMAYLDVDLSVSLNECHALTQHLNNGIDFVFGSRIAIVGSVIERKFFRFVTGRIIATFISNILRLKVYDTQCGCKLFTKGLAEKLFDSPFCSKWLFDVELFFRMYGLYGKDNAIRKMIEIPLKKWEHKEDSKVSYGYFFKLFTDLYKIRKKYKDYLSNKPLT
jgi:dolichyl-phosphate beta-glucosyltransferase